MKKILSAAFVLFGFIIIYLSISTNFLNEENLSSLTTPETILTNAINKDLIDMKNRGKLPEEWDSIRNIKINASAINFSNQSPKLAISTTPDGKFSLECTILNENPSSKDGRYLVKFSIIEIKNNNQLWEQFRLYQRQ